MPDNDVSVRGCEHCRYTIIASPEKLPEALALHTHSEAEGQLPPDFVEFTSPKEANDAGYAQGVLVFQYGKLVPQAS